MATELKPVVRGVSVVYLYVRDLERSVAFYRDVLGVPLESEDENWAEAWRDSTRFALHAAHDGVGDLRKGTVQVDFEVEDIDAAAARLREAGVEVREIQRQPYGSHCTFVDPDGYELELFQPAR